MVFATAAGLPAYVVLLAQAAWMHGPELGELPLQVLDLAFDLGTFIGPYYYSIILFVNYFII